MRRRAREEIERDAARHAGRGAPKDKSIEFSVIGDNNLVLPLKLDSATLHLMSGKQADTSETTISVKTRIPRDRGQQHGAGGQARAISRQHQAGGPHASSTSDGDFEISIVKPAQYRDPRHRTILPPTVTRRSDQALHSGALRTFDLTAGPPFTS